MNTLKVEHVADINDRIKQGVWVTVTKEQADELLALDGGIYDVHVAPGVYAVHGKVFDVYLENKVKTEIPADRVVEQPVAEVSAREKALEECISNYEEAMGMVLARATNSEKEAKKAKLKFVKLVKVVMFNAKNAKHILSLVGVDYE